MVSDIVMETQEGSVRGLINRILLEQPRYVGVYAPGDFRGTTYRIVIPNPKSSLTGRGYHGVREEVAIESYDRNVVDELLEGLETLVDTINGPRAVRHIVNPSGGKDEGIRLVWAKDGEAGEAEMADWPRRDALIRQGKTVRAADDSPAPSPLAELFELPPRYPSDQGGAGGMWPLLHQLPVDVPME